MREHIELMYILKNRVEKGIVYFFCQIIFREILLLTFGSLDNICIFFNSLKIRISVFYMIEHTEFVYIPPKMYNKALYIFSNRLYSEPFSFNFGAPRYYLDLFQLA